MSESEYLEFQDVIDGRERKTERIHVVSKSHGVILGDISWYGPWRQYVFFPDDDTLFNRACLRDIADFLDELMEAKKK